jgi:hypothetical protein
MVTVAKTRTENSASRPARSAIVLFGIFMKFTGDPEASIATRVIADLPPSSRPEHFSGARRGNRVSTPASS